MLQPAQHLFGAVTVGLIIALKDRRLRKAGRADIADPGDIADHAAGRDPVAEIGKVILVAIGGLQREKPVRIRAGLPVAEDAPETGPVRG